MQQFEIKIFANPSGFQELKLNGSEILITQEIVEKRNFDGDYGTFKDGTFSVMFTPKAFIIDYIFNVVAEANFRDPQTHITIAIERGYKLRDAYLVFAKLRKEFNLIAAEYKDNITRYLYNKIDYLNKLVAENIEVAPDQFRISSGEIDMSKRAIASYETESQLNTLLENPNIIQFKLYSLVYLLKKSDASDLYKKESIKKLYKPIVLGENDFATKLKYDVVFPDNHIETIYSRNDKIDYTCEKKNYTSERFLGTLSEHIIDWEVTQSDDCTQFFIRKRLKPITKVFNIVCFDSLNNPVNTPQCLKFSFGTFDQRNSTLLLTGDEIDRDLICFSEDKTTEVFYIRRNENSIYYSIKRLYCYDVSNVFDFVRKTAGEEISEIKILLKGRGMILKVLTRMSPKYYCEKGPDELEYEIPETKKFLSKKTGFTYDCSPSTPQLQKKDTVDIEFVIKNELIVNSLVKSPVFCDYYTENYKKRSKGNPLQEKFKEDGHLLIKDLPIGHFSYHIKIKGYKDKNDELILKSNNGKKLIELKFEKNSIKKTFDFIYHRIALIFIFILGVVIGVFIQPYIREGKDEISDDSMVKDSLKKMNDRLIALELEKTNLEKRVEELKKTQPIVSNDDGVEKPTDTVSEQHPEQIQKLIQLPNTEKKDIKNENTFVNKIIYNKLSDQEKKDFEIIYNHPAYSTIIVPKEITTIEAAKKYLDQKNGTE